jgi:ribosomal protein S18 acetylase RimI-like enzyme
MDIEIKKADDDDRTGLRIILQNSFDTLSSLDIIEIDCYIDGQQRPCQWFVARSTQGQVIGCINASTRSNEGYINSLSVIESYRGHGVGSMLVKEACEFLKTNGCNSVFLYVRPTNEGAQVFYEKLGFINCGLTKSHLLEDVVMLRKMI